MFLELGNEPYEFEGNFPIQAALYPLTIGFQSAACPTAHPPL